ncbi:hypothetical protein [Rosettibacter firmus]|uniref:hypothetical protein n=1 Tax=Rosettibacter firmus TaxID=3111522 RepID=UPI00336BEA84
MRKILLIILTLILFKINLYPQTFGFGCLGLSGFYAGITQQEYESKGITEYLFPESINNPDLHTDFNFKKATGYRVGANIFRAKFSKVFITAKGYYQFLKESHNRQIYTDINGERNYKYELSMNHWGVGLDLGFPIFSLLDFKLLEGHVTFMNPEFSTEELDVNNNILNENKLTTDKVRIGYFVGSGIIVHLIPDYVSIEATAGYSFYLIEKFYDDNKNIVIPVQDSKNYPVNKSKFSATLQLNVGFPL